MNTLQKTMIGVVAMGTLGLGVTYAAQPMNLDVCNNGGNVVQYMPKGSTITFKTSSQSGNLIANKGQGICVGKQFPTSAVVTYNGKTYTIPFNQGSNLAQRNQRADHVPVRVSFTVQKVNNPGLNALGSVQLDAQNELVASSYVG